MSETTATNPGDGELLPETEVVETGAAAPEAEAPEAEVELDDEGNPIEQPEPDEEVEEIEVNGVKYAVPKALAPALMKDADYTQKTQDLAKERRAFEEEATAHRKATAEADQADIQQRAKVVALDDHLSALDRAIERDSLAIQNVDYDALAKMENGLLEFQMAQIELQALKDARAKLSGDKTTLQSEIETRTRTRALELQQASAKQIEERDAVLSRDIPNWTERRKEVEAFALKAGVPEAALKGTTDPLIFKMLDLAIDGAAAREAKAKAAAVAKRVQPAITGAVRPVPKVTGASVPRTDPNRMSTDDWMAHRRGQLRKKGGR